MGHDATIPRIWPHLAGQSAIDATPNVVPHGGRNDVRYIVLEIFGLTIYFSKIKEKIFKNPGGASGSCAHCMWRLYYWADPGNFVFLKLVGKSSFHTPHLYVLSGFQPPTIKPGMQYPRSIKTV
jgi:hypothetical protein